MKEPHEVFRSRVAATVAGGHLGERALQAWQARTMVLVLDDDVDWTNPASPVARAERLRSIDDDDVWKALIETKPGWVNLAVYPLVPGDLSVLVLAKQHPRNGAFQEPAIVMSGAGEGQALTIQNP